MLSPLRLPLSRAVATSLLLLTLVSTVTAEEVTSLSTTAPLAPTACKRLSDGTSPFVSTLSLLASVGGGSSGLAAVSASGIFAKIDEALPALSQCVAGINPFSLLSSVSSLAAASPQTSQCWSDVKTSTSAQLITGEGKVLFGDVVCPAFTKLAPCLTDVLLPELEKAMANTGGCCAPLLAEINAGFGAPLTPAINSLVQILGNAFCSQRSSLSEPTTSENCGDSLVKNWLPLVDENDEKEYWNLLNTFQIPNDQACKAARSEPFQTTMNKTQQYGAPGVTPYGLCFTPMDALQQYVRALPLWRLVGGDETARVVESVYATDSCLAGRDFLTWASADDGWFMKGVRLADDLFGTLGSLTGKTNTNATSPTMAPTVTPTPTPTPSDKSDDSSGSNEEEDATDDEPDLFDSPENLSGGPTVDELANANWTEIVRTKLWELNLVAEQLCFHIPNGVQCSFPGDLLSVPYPQFGTLSLDDGPAGTAPPPPTAPSDAPLTTPPTNPSTPGSTSSGPSTGAGTGTGTGTSPTPGTEPQPSAAVATPSPTVGAANSSTGNSSSAMTMRQHHDSALAVVVVTTIAAIMAQLL